MLRYCLHEKLERATFLCPGEVHILLSIILYSHQGRVTATTVLAWEGRATIRNPTLAYCNFMTKLYTFKVRVTMYLEMRFFQATIENY